MVIVLASMAVASAKPRVAQVGDFVSFPFGTYTAQGLVIEDRGPLGRNGERILRVRVDVGSDAEPLVTEILERLALVLPRR